MPDSYARLRYNEAEPRIIARSNRSINQHTLPLTLRCEAFIPLLALNVVSLRCGIRSAIGAYRHRAAIGTRPGSHPTGKSPGQFVDPSVQPLLKKYSDFPKPQISPYVLRLVPREGRFAIVTDAGRDAVAAGGAEDESAFLRTAKSCGPDASTLASSSWEASFSGATVTKKPDRRGEYDISRKTIAWGMPGDSGVT
jgi:hypothetical protein